MFPLPGESLICHYHSICLSTVSSWYNGVVTVTVWCYLPRACTSHLVPKMTQEWFSYPEICSKFTTVQYSKLRWDKISSVSSIYLFYLASFPPFHLPLCLLSPLPYSLASLPPFLLPLHLLTPPPSSLEPLSSLLLTVHHSWMTFDPAIQGLLMELSS